MIVVESGVLAVASTSHDAGPLTSGELGVSAPAPHEGEERAEVARKPRRPEVQQ